LTDDQLVAAKRIYDQLIGGMIDGLSVLDRERDRAPRPQLQQAGVYLSKEMKIDRFILTLPSGYSMYCITKVTKQAKKVNKHTFLYNSDRLDGLWFAQHLNAIQTYSFSQLFESGGSISMVIYD
jgi:hypothetical protein